MKYLLYILYSLYLLLLLITDLVPSNEWNSIWISAVLAFCTVSFYQISERYGESLPLLARASPRTVRRLTDSPAARRKSHEAALQENGPEAVR